MRVGTDDARGEAQSAPMEVRSRRLAFVHICTRLASLAWWWHLLAVAVLAAGVITAAYQAHPAVDIAIGDRVQDDPLVVDFNSAERQPANVGGRVYRWTRDESAIAFPGIGRTAATVTLTMAAGANPNPEVTVLANGGEIGHVHLTPDFAEYVFPVAAPYVTTGNLTLTLRAATFRPPNDARDLGVLVSHVRVQPAGGITRPPARTALALWGDVLLLMVVLLIVGVRAWEAGAAALVVAIGFAALVVTHRLFIALGAAPWLRVAVVTLALAAGLRLAVPPLLRRLGIAATRHDARWLLAAVVGVFAVRLGGLYHPATIVSDLVFHAHRLEDLVVRHVWYQEIAAVYDNNRPAPYPPGAYLLFAPIAFIIHTSRYPDLLTIGTQVLDATRILIVGLVVWRAVASLETEGSSSRDGNNANLPTAPGTATVAAVCAALLAGIVPIAFLVFSWGNLTNMVGEWALTGIFAALVLGGEGMPRPLPALGFVALVLLALLAHVGVAVTAVALLGAFFAVRVLLDFGAGRVPWRDVGLRRTVILATIGGVLAFALFYWIPLAGTHTAASGAPSDTPVPVAPGGKYLIGGPRPDPSIGLDLHRTNNPLVAVAGQLWEEADAYYRFWPLLLAPLGWWLLWRAAAPIPIPSPAERERGDSVEAPELYANATRSRSPLPFTGEGPGVGAEAISHRLAMACVTWFGASLLFLMIGVVTGRYVRYSITVIPAVAAGAGVVLGYAWRWRWGRAVALLLLALSMVTTLLLWYTRITEAYHR